jgi:hypothetical protein
MPWPRAPELLDRIRGQGAFRLLSRGASVEIGEGEFPAEEC